MSNEWVEVEAKSIDDAIKVGLKELNLENSTEAEINILREPEGGVFGVGGVKALVRISVRENKGYGERRRARTNKRERPRHNQDRGKGRYNQERKRESRKRQTSRGKLTKWPKNRPEANNKNEDKPKRGHSTMKLRKHQRTQNTKAKEKKAEYLNGNTTA